MRPSIYEWNEDRTEVIVTSDGGRGERSRFLVARGGEKPTHWTNVFKDGTTTYETVAVPLIKVE